MTHQEIQDGEIIERYVRRQLAPDERRAFQEHYFACDECFEQVQTTARFVAAVRQSSRKGSFAESAAEPATWWKSLFTPAIGFAAAALLLAVAIGWLMLRQSPAPRQDFAREQQPSPSPNQTGAPDQNTARIAAPSPEKPERNDRPKLQDQRDLLAQNRTPEESSGKPPSVLLESSRDASAGGNQLTLPANASSVILRIEVEPDSSFTGFQFQLLDSARRLVATVTNGKASARGTVSVNVPAHYFQSGKYLVKCFGLKNGQRELVGEYDLRVHKP
ncbi:MAG: hypothetical protein AB7U82_25155 [Blastocatellales bacterium]